MPVPFPPGGRPHQDIFTNICKCKMRMYSSAPSNRVDVQSKKVFRRTTNLSVYIYIYIYNIEREVEREVEREREIYIFMNLSIYIYIYIC